jgi:hypothetical protein
VDDTSSRSRLLLITAGDVTDEGAAIEFIASLAPDRVDLATP